MPNYGIRQAGGVLTAIQPGDAFDLFLATEIITPPQASVAFCTGYSPGGGAPAAILFTIDFATAPTDVVEIQASNQDVDADYQTQYTSTSKQHDSYLDAAGFAFYRAKLTSQSAGGAVAVIAKR